MRTVGVRGLAAALAGAGALAVSAGAQDVELWDTDNAWGRTATAAPDDPARGRQVYEQWCMICHGTGPGMAGTEALERRYRGGELPVLLTEREDLTPELVTTFVRQGVGDMPYFRKTEITDADLAVLGAYLSGGAAE